MARRSEGAKAMFGMINRGFQRFILRELGAEAWSAIWHHANVDTSTFISIDMYDDDVSFRLFEAAARYIGCSRDELLERFGESWIDGSVADGFGNLLRLGGDNVTDFILNLDHLHTRLGLSYDSLRPPSFQVERMGAENAPPCFRLHYRSHRHGFASFVVGVLRGLGKHFDEPLDVRIEEAIDERPISFWVQPVSRRE